MTWFADLSPCTVFSVENYQKLLAVGWLESNRQYAVGDVPVEVYERLRSLLRDPWQPIASMGLHACDLCRFEAEAQGNRNLFVPRNGVIYVCPELILHYVNA